MDTLALIHTIGRVLAALFLLCYGYQLALVPLAHLLRGRPHRPARRHRYAVLICARNEQQVIGPLLESLRRQDYPKELVKVFVAADNCTDDTAAVARAGGAVVYERCDTARVGKGWALEWLLARVQADWGDVFDGYFVFDADNLLAEDYITQMDATFGDGYRIVTSYRNSKNFADNWISAGYALWFLRESRYLNHARMLLGTSAAVSGTGFLFGREVLRRHGGWHFHLLTEDIEFTVASVLYGEQIGYCAQACLYDEQPVTFRQSWRQRMRWAKGYLQVFGRYGTALVRGAVGTAQAGGLRRRLSCYDMTMAIMPAIVLSLATLACDLAAAALALAHGLGLWAALLLLLRSFCGSYLLLLALGGLTTLTQWRRIPALPWQKIVYTFTFPLFMLTYIPISLAALFAHVEWKPIQHSAALTLTQVRGRAVRGHGE